VNPYKELENIKSDIKLRGKIASHLLNYWKYLNIKSGYDNDDAIRFFISDEKGKVDFIDKIDREISPLKGKRVLDVGCGKGGVIISCGLKGAKVIGLDINEDELQIAKLRISSFEVDNVSLVNGIIERIPFEDNSFDLIIASSVLEHLKKFEKAIEEMVRLTKPGGFCITTTPNPLFPREGHYKVKYVPYLPKRFGKLYLKARGFNPDFFIKNVTYPYPSISKIEKIFRKNGMSVTNVTEEEILNKFNDYSLIETKKILESVGFKNVKRYDWCDTIHKDYDDFSQAYIPHRDNEKGILISLNVEAEK